MKKNLRWKVVLVVAVIVLCLYLAYPPSEKIQYGLDLQGGMHLVLQVMTDDAINYETDQAVLSLREELQKENITYTSVSKLEGQIGEFTIQEFDLEKEREVRDMLGDYFRDWDFTVRNGTFSCPSNRALISTCATSPCSRPWRPSKTASTSWA
jgi:preprotein translocase subunit SecD